MPKGWCFFPLVLLLNSETPEIWLGMSTKYAFRDGSRPLLQCERVLNVTNTVSREIRSGPGLLFGTHKNSSQDVAFLGDLKHKISVSIIDCTLASSETLALQADKF